MSFDEGCILDGKPWPATIVRGTSTKEGLAVLADARGAAAHVSGKNCRIRGFRPASEAKVEFLWGGKY